MVPARNRIATSASAASASACLMNSMAGSGRSSVLTLLAPRFFALTVIGSAVPTAICGRSSTQPLAMRIQPPHSDSCSEFDDRLLQILLRHVDREPRLRRTANHHFHGTVPMPGRVAVMAAAHLASVTRALNLATMLGSRSRICRRFPRGIFARQRKADGAAQPPSGTFIAAARARAPSSRKRRPSPATPPMPALFR